MDDLDAEQQPRCPECGIVMRDVAGGWKCPECGETMTADVVDVPRFDGPSIRGG